MKRSPAGRFGLAAAFVASCSASLPINAVDPPKVRSGGALYANSVFDSSVERLPREFLGVSPLALMQALLKAPQPKKGEFETTAEFEERQDKWMARPILGAVKPQSRIALSLSTQTAPNQMKAAYDADGGLMTVEVSRSYCGDAVGVEIFSNLKDQGSYIGSNAFGVKKVIKRTSITRYCLDGVPLDPMQFAISRDKASQEKARLKVLVVGRLREPYVKVVENYSSPTITSPYEVHSTSYVLILDVDEVWVFNGTTGQIHFKPVPAPAPPSATANPGSIDSNGNTALHVALWQDRFEEAIEIIEKGEININHQNIFGATPLHLAVAKKNARVVKRLLAAGAVRDIADRHGDTPLMDARKSSLAEIVRLLDEK